jgi:hypothetical protein
VIFMQHSRGRHNGSHADHGVAGRRVGGATAIERHPRVMQAGQTRGGRRDGSVPSDEAAHTLGITTAAIGHRRRALAKRWALAPDEDLGGPQNAGHDRKGLEIDPGSSLLNIFRNISCIKSSGSSRRGRWACTTCATSGYNRSTSSRAAISSRSRTRISKSASGPASWDSPIQCRAPGSPQQDKSLTHGTSGCYRDTQKNGTTNKPNEHSVAFGK